MNSETCAFCKIAENVPPEFLVEAEARERAARPARPVTERLRKTIEREVLRLLEEGVPEEDVLKRISEKYAYGLTRLGDY